jgi:hypothetical protein
VSSNVTLKIYDILETKLQRLLMKKMVGFMRLSFPGRIYQAFVFLYLSHPAIQKQKNDIDEARLLSLQTGLAMAGGKIPVAARMSTRRLNLSIRYLSVNCIKNY